NYLVVSLFFPGARGPVEVPYTLFREQVAAGNVSTIATRGDTIQGLFAEPIQFTVDLPTAAEDGPVVDPVAVQSFSTTLPIFVGDDLEGLLLQNGVVINAETLDAPRNPLLTLLISFGPALLMIGLLIWISRRFTAGGALGGGLGGAFGMGKSKAKRYDEA